MERAAIGDDPSSRACGSRNERSARPRRGSSFRSQDRTSSGPELHPYEVVRRPGPSDSEVEGSLTLGFPGDSLLEALEALAVDQKRRPGDDAIFLVTVGLGQRYRC